MWKLFNMLITALLLALVAAVVFGFFLSWMTGRSDDQDVFVAGTVPAPLPDGLYAGSAEHQGSWKGKKFDRTKNAGINLFATRTGEKEAYPFRTWTGQGLTDNETVLKVDYDLDENPFWLRPALDELVQIRPGLLLGKLQYRLIPGYPFALTFFRLEMSPTL